MDTKLKINRYIGKEPQEFRIVGYSIRETSSETIQYKSVIAQNEQSLDIIHLLRWRPTLVR